MALRTENNTHKRAHAMASRTKDNLKVFNPEEENAREEREQKMKEFLAKKLRIERGLGKDDENEKKTEETSKHDHSVSKHSSSGDTHSSSSKHKSDRKGKDKSSSKHSKHKHDSHQREYNREDTSSKVHSSEKVSNKNEDVKSDIGVKKKPKVKNRPPQNGHTALNFNQLLALAKQKQFLPTDEPTKQERRDNDRPLTQDEKNQLEVDKERAAFRQSKEYKHWLKYGGERPQPSKRLDTAPIEAKKRNPHWHSSRRISEAYVNEADSDCDDGPPPVSKLPKIRKLGSQSQPVSKPYCSSGSESDQGHIPPSRQLSMAKKRKSTGDLGHGTARHGLSKHVKGRANYHSCSESDEGPIPPSRQLSIAKKGKSTGDLGHGTARHKGRTNDHSCSESDEGPIPPSRQLNMAKKRKSTGDLGHGTARHSLSKGRSNYENGTECDYEPKAKIIKKETTHKTSHSTLSNTSGKYSQSSANHKSPHRKHAAQTPSHKSHEKTSNHTSSNEKSSSHKSSHQRSSTHPVSSHKDSSRSRQSASKLNTQSSKHNPVNIKKEKTDTANIKKEKTDRRREEVRPVGSVKKKDVSMSKEKRDPGKLNLFPGKSFNKETIAKLQRMKGLTNKSNGVSSSQNSSSSGDRHSISSKNSVISKSTGQQSKPSKQLNTAQNVPSKKPPTSSTSKTKAASSAVKVKSETNAKSRPSQKPAAQSSRKQAAPSRIPDPGHRRTDPGPPLNPHMSTWDRIYGQIEKQHPKPGIHLFLQLFLYLTLKTLMMYQSIILHIWRMT